MVAQILYNKLYSECQRNPKSSKCRFPTLAPAFKRGLSAQLTGGVFYRQKTLAAQGILTYCATFLLRYPILPCRLCGRVSYRPLPLAQVA